VMLYSITAVLVTW